MGPRLLPLHRFRLAMRCQLERYVMLTRPNSFRVCAKERDSRQSGVRAPWHTSKILRPQAHAFEVHAWRIVWPPTTRLSPVRPRQGRPAIAPVVSTAGWPPPAPAPPTRLPLAPRRASTCPDTVCISPLPTVFCIPGTHSELRRRSASPRLCFGIQRDRVHHQERRKRGWKDRPGTGDVLPSREWSIPSPADRGARCQGRRGFSWA